MPQPQLKLQPSAIEHQPHPSCLVQWSTTALWQALKTNLGLLSLMFSPHLPHPQDITDTTQNPQPHCYV